VSYIFFLTCIFFRNALFRALFTVCYYTLRDINFNWLCFDYVSNGPKNSYHGIVIVIVIVIVLVLVIVIVIVIVVVIVIVIKDVIVIVIVIAIAIVIAIVIVE
jgi:hypothetical protein